MEKGCYQETKFLSDNVSYNLVDITLEFKYNPFL